MLLQVLEPSWATSTRAFGGEHSIFGQIEAQGVDPKNHIFIFNLRSYDWLNVTQALKAQEKSGIPYQELQRAEADEIMTPDDNSNEARAIRSEDSRTSVKASA